MVLVNHGRSPAVIEPQMRVAQLVIAAFVRADVEAVSSLDDTARGAGGYGSTGA